MLAGYLAGAFGGGPDRLPGREALVRSVRESVFGDALDERLDPAEGGAGSDGPVGAERDRQAASSRLRARCDQALRPRRWLAAFPHRTWG